MSPFPEVVARSFTPYMLSTILVIVKFLEKLLKCPMAAKCQINTNTYSMEWPLASMSPNMYLNHSSNEC